MTIFWNSLFFYAYSLIYQISSITGDWFLLWHYSDLIQRKVALEKSRHQVTLRRNSTKVLLTLVFLEAKSTMPLSPQRQLSELQSFPSYSDSHLESYVHWFIQNLRRELICSKKAPFYIRGKRPFMKVPWPPLNLKVVVPRKPEPPGDAEYNSTWYSIPITSEIASVFF